MGRVGESPHANLVARVVQAGWGAGGGAWRPGRRGALILALMAAAWIGGGDAAHAETPPDPPSTQSGPEAPPAAPPSVAPPSVAPPAVAPPAVAPPAVAPPAADEDAAPARTYLDAATFRQNFEGKTVHLTLGDVYYGSEQYLPNDETVWVFRDGACQRGVWSYNTPLFCFRYEDPTPSCWLVYESAGTFFAQSVDGLTLEITSIETTPLTCGSEPVS